MKAFHNFIIFKTDTLFNYGVKFKGIGGRELVVDPSFEPAKHVRIYGEVVSVPVRLGRTPIAQERVGAPGYYEQSPFRYKFLSDIEPEVQVGDRIYYHFNTIHTKNMVREDGVHPNRTWFYKVQYDQVMCAVRNGEIICIGGYCLVDPDMETWEDISIPVPEVGTDGKPLLNTLGEVINKPKDQWLVRKAMPGNKYLVGFVRHVGSPLKGDKREVEVGDRILYQRYADWTVNIEGKDYFVIKQRHIMGVVGKDTKITEKWKRSSQLN